MSRAVRTALLAVAISGGSMLASACDEPVQNPDPVDALLRPRSEPIEYVGLTITRPIVGEADFLDVVGPLFGQAAQDGTRHQRFELDPGILLSASDDPRTREQVVLTMEMVPTDGTPARTILRVPASFQYGQLFIETVRVALATTQRKLAAGDSMEPWHLEYHVVSANGGYLMIQANYEDEAAQLVVRTDGPRTSLLEGRINTAAFASSPQELVGGTVNFSLSRDEFDFFTSRAYGVSAAREQNFRDFRLLPHDWLRITVTPLVDIGMVDVAFEVVMLDGSRVPLARAPASYVVGEQFRQNVFRMVDNMHAMEDAQPGSSRPFTVPFHYDDPQGGGVVRVIASGVGGRFKIAYAVDSPAHALREVDFVPYVGDPLAGGVPPPTRQTSCEELGSIDATRGKFVVRFDASATVRESRMLTNPIRGNVYGSVYRASDVTIGGPNDGAEPVATFAFDDVDLSNGPSAQTYVIDTEVSVGEYQILGFIDIDANGTAERDPDVGDPVTLPIGNYRMRCAEQPAVVEFALLLPEGV